LSLLEQLPRSASAYAQTNVRARRIGVEDFEALAQAHPKIGFALAAALGRAAATKLRQTNDRLAQAIFPELPDPEVEAMVARAAAAQRAIEGWSEPHIDALLRAMARVVFDAAAELAEANLAESGIGDVGSKILKIQVCSRGVCDALLRQIGLGPITTDPRRRVTEIASPVGVVFGLGPVTNPVSTFIFKALICVKSRNALILSPNRGAQRVTARTGDLIAAVLRDHDAPPDLIQSVRSMPKRRRTLQFMAHPGVGLVLATGGASMVKAAYSSGTPAIGVGPGNTPVLICPDADLSRVVRGIIMSKTFDNGLPCGAEHNLVVLAAARQPFVEECERQGCAVLSPDEATTFSAYAIAPGGGRFRPDITGQPAAKIAAAAGIHRDYPIRLIIVPDDSPSTSNPYAREKMAPLLSLFTVPDADAGVALCRELLAINGTGHTAVIHSEDAALIARFGEAMPASRILANTPAVHGMLGITTGLDLTATLGCGTFGGTSTTDNVTYRHLLNIKRLAHYSPEAAALWEAVL
jgi:acetaldehyde dehydrogenase/alcohol dehydrogenase